MHPHPSPCLLFHFSSVSFLRLALYLLTFCYFSNYQVAVLGLLTGCIHLAKIHLPSVTGICNYLSGSAQPENSAEDSFLWIPTHILTFRLWFCYISLPHSYNPVELLPLCTFGDVSSCHLVCASSREGTILKLIHWQITWSWLWRTH